MSKPTETFNEAPPQWKPWYRWPFLIVVLAGAAMIVIGVQECVALWQAIRAGSPDIVVETAMSAFPPLGAAIMATGSLAFFPRSPDGTRIRIIRTRSGKEYNPALIVTMIGLAGLLLYPILGSVLHVVTANILTARGYMETSETGSHTSGYMRTHWQRKS